MRSLVVSPVSRLQGIITLPGDKSIAHRAIILSVLAQGKNVVENFPLSQDCLATVAAFKKLGIKIIINKGSCQAVIYGKGLCGLKKPASPIYIKESGTTFRLLLGVCAGQAFKVELSAGPSLSRRPMFRVIHPLKLMGASVEARKVKKELYPPLVIQGGHLKGIIYKLPVASAQVKSALLLAGLFAQGKTTLIEPIKTRDHTERMLKLFKAATVAKGNAITISKAKGLVSARNIYLPGDISSAAFFMVGAGIIPGSKVLIKSVSLNPGRFGVINVLKRMGVRIKIYEKSRNYEPMADILIKSGTLKPVRIAKKEIPLLIDELPALMVAACFARGESIFEGVGELRVKETDRVQSMLVNLNKMDAKIKAIKLKGREDIVISGLGKLQGASLKSFGDHRTAMSMIIAGLAAEGRSRIDDVSCINKSFPNFLKILKSLI